MSSITAVPASIVECPFPLTSSTPSPITSPTMIHDNLPAAIENLSARMFAIRDSLDFPTKLARRKELEAKMGQTSFWDNQESAKGVVAELKVLKAMIDPIESLLRG